MTHSNKFQSHPLMVSESGIRGLAGSALSPELVMRCAFVYGEKDKEYLLARDRRLSSLSLYHAAVSGLLSKGAKVCDAGILATPTAQLAVKDNDFHGGILITASHNSWYENGLKFISSQGEFVPRSTVQNIYKQACDEQWQWSQSEFGNMVEKQCKHTEYHVNKIIKLLELNLQQVKDISIAVDTSNGAALEAVLLVTKKLNITVYMIHEEGKPHVYNPEDTEEHFKTLREKVVEKQCIAGFGFDSDGDRLTVVDEKGNLVVEDFSIALAIKDVLAHHAGTVVVNDSTSMAVDFVAEKFNVTCLRSAVGEANVVTKMKQSNAVIGGEGNGGLILPALHYGRDGILQLLVFLNLLLNDSYSIHQEVKAFQNIQSCKCKFDADDELLEKLVAKFGKILPSQHADSGYKFQNDDSWVTIRYSNTEPIIRVIAESRNSEQFDQINEIVISFQNSTK